MPTAKTIKPPEIYLPLKYNWKDIARYVSEVLEKPIHPSYASLVWWGKRENKEVYNALFKVMSKK